MKWRQWSYFLIVLESPLIIVIGRSLNGLKDLNPSLGPFVCGLFLISFPKLFSFLSFFLVTPCFVMIFSLVWSA